MANDASGIYAIQCSATDRVYIGSSRQLYKRLAQHRRQLESGRHIRRQMQGDWDAYGPDAFTFNLVEQTPPDDHSLDAAETRHIRAAGARAYNYGDSAGRLSTEPACPARLRSANMREVALLLTEALDAYMELNRLTLRIEHAVRRLYAPEWVATLPPLPTLPDSGVVALPDDYFALADAVQQWQDMVTAREAALA